MAADSRSQAIVAKLARHQESERAAIRRRAEEYHRTEAEKAERRMSVKTLRNCWKSWPSLCKAYFEDPTRASELIERANQMITLLEHILPGTVERLARESEAEPDPVCRAFLQLLYALQVDGPESTTAALATAAPRPDFSNAADLAERLVATEHLDPYNGIEVVRRYEHEDWESKGAGSLLPKGFSSSKELEAARWLYETEVKRNRSTEITNESIKKKFKKLCDQHQWKYRATRQAQLRLIEKYSQAFSLPVLNQNKPGRKSG